jgi:hypothetical protein
MEYLIAISNLQKSYRIFRKSTITLFRLRVFCVHQIDHLCSYHIGAILYLYYLLSLHLHVTHFCTQNFLYRTRVIYFVNNSFHWNCIQKGKTHFWEWRVLHQKLPNNSFRWNCIRMDKSPLFLSFVRGVRQIRCALVERKEAWGCLYMLMWYMVSSIQYIVDIG